MKSTRLVIITLIALIFSVSACGELPTKAPTQAPTLIPPTSTVPVTQAPTSDPVPEVTVLKLLENAFCYSGPGDDHPVKGLLVSGDHFEILGMNADSAWFSINPTELMDPDPPHSPLNEIMDPSPPHSPRCWVFNGSVEIIGALAGVPMVQVPRLGVLEQSGCYSGPGEVHHLISTLYPDQFFDILALDDASVGNHGAPVDAGSAWFQVNPTALIDPTPPYSPLDASLGACTPYFQGVPRCWVPGSSVMTSGDLAALPIVETPRMGVIEGTGCYSGPGEGYALENQLLPDLHFEILAIDDDVAWQDNGLNQIDDDVAWLEVDPNAMIDPEPPHRPLNELSPQPDPPGAQLSPRCWVPAAMVETSGDLAQLPFPTVPFMATMEDTYCYTGPGYNYKALSRLNLDEFFNILGIDDDVAWIDDDVAWRGIGWNQIDDDVAWFNIDPNAVIDPNPPYQPLNALIDPDPPYSLMSTRCWVPINRTALCGDLLMLPILPAPLTLVPTFTATVFTQPEEEKEVTKTPESPPPPAPPSCSDFKTQNECNAHANDMQCYWSQKDVCVKQ